MIQQDIINNWLALHVRGESLSRFFPDNEIHSCAIYGCGVLGDMFYEEATQCGCEIVAAIDRAVIEFHDCRLIHPADIGELKKVDLIVICMEYTIEREWQIREYLDDAPFPSVYLSDIISACWYKQIILPYCKMAGVTPYVVSTPMYCQLEGLTDYERAIGAIRGDGEFYSQNHGYYSGIYTSVDEYGDDYIKNVFLPPPVVQRGQTSVHTDSRSPYVNVLGGIRYTRGNPEEYVRTVHILGNCIAFGVGVDDSRTVASQLQKLLNAHSDEYSRIRVMNHGIVAPVSNRPLKQYYNLCSLHLSKGDTVVFFYDLLFSRRRYDVRFYQKMYNSSYNVYTTLDACFNAPHGNRILYINNHRLSLHGMELAARYIYSLITQDNSIVIKGKQKKEKMKQTPGKKEQVESFGRSGGLHEYVSYLNQFASGNGEPCGAIVMNCNPFTCGHRKLIEWAAAKVSKLYLFVVEEDRSVFSFADRKKLIELGTSDLGNVAVLPSGKFILSALTFPEYFRKDSLQDVVVDTSLDIEIFAKYIAPALNIKTRFVGQEPFDLITRQYNQNMRDILPRYGIQFVEFPRFEVSDVPVSASRIRALLQEKEWNEIGKMVPESTLSFLKEKFDQ